MEDMNQISQAIVDGKLELAQELVGKAIESGMDAQTIINDYLTVGMAEIGQRFQDRKAFVPNLLMSAPARLSVMIFPGRKFTPPISICSGVITCPLHIR